MAKTLNKNNKKYLQVKENQLKTKQKNSVLKTYFSQNKKTRILAVGDIHGDTRMVNRLAEKAKKEHVDLVILAGDLTFAENSTKNLIGPFLKEKKQVLIIPGNHESLATTNFLAEMYSPNTTSIHGYSFIKKNVGIFGAGSGDVGIFKLRDEEILKLLTKGHEKVKDVKKRIMVTHIQPHRTKIEKVGGFEGSRAVRKAIEKFQPDIAICAHLHNTGGIEEKIGRTRVISVSRKEVIFDI
jgi:uncharacterized protein